MTNMNQHIVSNTAFLSFDEIVFENRNKAYGSYDIRKRYIVSLMYALVFSLSAITITVVCPMIYYRYFQADQTVVFNPVGPNEVSRVDIDPTTVVPPPEVKAPAIVQQSYVAPIVVDTVDNSTPAFNDVATAVANTTNQVDPGSLNLTTPVTTDIEITPPVIETVTFAEEPALFKGGDLPAFSKWVQEQLVYPTVALDNRIEGKVTIEFTVGPHGLVDDIRVARSVDPALDNEVVRVLKLSPAWSEPRQNGKVVKQHFFLPVFFQLR